jgi:hypothetical protein
VVHVSPWNSFSARQREWIFTPWTIACHALLNPTKGFLMCMGMWLCQPISNLIPLSLWSCTYQILTLYIVWVIPKVWHATPIYLHDWLLFLVISAQMVYSQEVTSDCQVNGYPLPFCPPTCLKLLMCDFPYCFSSPSILQAACLMCLVCLLL